MSNLNTSLAPPNLTRVAVGAILGGLGVVAAIGVGFATRYGVSPLEWMAKAIAASRLHAPNLAILEAASPAIKIHLATISAALVLATLQMVLPKGRALHRVLGWTLVVLLMITSVAAVFIRNPFAGEVSPFVVFSAWTLFAAPFGVVAARAHNVRRHAGLMSGLYFGGLILAGLLTFLPGRMMWRIFFG
jgi:uncharacterized membrane protein